MDDSNGAPVLDSFALGPSTLLGRVVALKVLYCKALKELVVLFYAKTSEHLGRWRRFALRALGKVVPFLGPSNPGVMLAIVVAIALLLRRARHVAVRAERAYRRKFWSNLMETACTYEEWSHAAKMLENGVDRKSDGSLFDEELVRGKLCELKKRRLEGGVADILFCMRADLVRNLGNMCNPELHKGRLQTPKLIREYIDEVRLNLRSVCDTDSDEFTLEEKLAFIHETRHAFGRTALLLSGGAALGSFHLGVVRTLIEHRLLPRVVAGASVGSIICSFTATRTWTELQNFFEEAPPPMHFFESMGSIFATAHRLLTKGAVHEIGMLQRKMRQLIGDLTFQEAYDLSGRVLGISVCSPRKHEPPRLLNYLNSPHVVIWSAVTASCAFPGLFEAQELMAKDRHGRLGPYHTPCQVGPEEPLIGTRQWIDGSLESDLPMMQLKELFNVNHFIVSQANPHIAPLLRIKEVIRAYGGDFAAKLAHLVEMEVKHRCHQVLEMGFRLGGLAKLYAQDWEGDVTIVMPATFAQFAKIIQNPTPSELRKAVLQGRRATWAKVSAIQANCGIELMLDECVSELNRRRKPHRDSEKSGLQVVGTKLSAAKRIPSWNCLARESSWGSLDEDGIEASYHQAGGPWGGPTTIRKLRRPSQESDVDSGAENLELSQMSWTRAGGPLMRTASAATFILSLENDPETGNYSLNKDEVSKFTENELEFEGTVLNSGCFQTSPSQVNSWDKRSGKRANKISVKLGGVQGTNGDVQNDESDAEMNTFSFPRHPLKRSASAGMMISTAYLEGEFGTNHSFSGSIYSKNGDTLVTCELPVIDLITAHDDWSDAEKCSSLDDWTGHSGPKDSGDDQRPLDNPNSEEKSMGDALMGSPGGPSHRSLIGLRVQCKSLERGAFGSFISHDGTSVDGDSA